MRGNLAHWRSEAGQVASAISEYGQVLADRIRVLGPDHPDILTSRSNLAGARGEVGDVAGAIAEYERLVADSKQLFGPNHVTSVTIRSNLAYWRGKVIEDDTGTDDE